jgi:hypothetical protein
MYHMYQLGKRIHHHRRLWRTAGLVLLVGAAGFAIYHLDHATTKPKSTVHNSPPVNTPYSPSNTAKVHFSEPLFTVELPAGWQSVKSTADVNVPSYTYKSPSADGQELDVYIDNTPSNLAVNRVLVVSPAGPGLQYGTVSDNCVNFTRPSGKDPGSEVAAGKWQGTNFICDLGNYERDLIGITSTDGLNDVTLTGPNAGTHQVFIDYTDNSINPDYSTLYNILSSFTFK